MRTATRPRWAKETHLGRTSSGPPKALMKLPRTEITRAKFPVLDIHLHAGSLKTAADYQKMIALMDQTGIGVICNMDGGFGKAFDQNMKMSEPYRDRIIEFARINWDG